MKIYRIYFLVFIGFFISNSLKADDCKSLQNLFNSSKKNIDLANKNYYLSKPINIPANKNINGNGAKFIFTKIPIKQWCITLNSNSSIKNLTIQSNTQPSLLDFTQNGAAVYNQFNFNYTPNMLVLWLMGNQVSLDNITIIGSYKGIGGNIDGAVINNVNIQGAYACMEMYISKHITVTNSTFTGGTFGCITFASCSDVRVENCILKNPKSTGVNPGGAADHKMIAKNITILNNNIIAGDCVNLENGVSNALIKDNIIYCAPIVNKSINNSAIGVQVHDPKANGITQNITITNNTISSFQNIIYGIGINVANMIGNSMSDIKILNNTVSGGNEGIRVQNTKNFMSDLVTISNNTINCYAFGLRLFQVSNATITDNTINAYKSTWNDNLWGIQMHKCSNLNLNKNSTKGFMIHYYETENSSHVTITKPTTLKGDLVKPFKVLFTDPTIIKTKDKIKLNND